MLGQIYPYLRLEQLKYTITEKLSVYTNIILCSGDKINVTDSSYHNNITCIKQLMMEGCIIHLIIPTTLVCLSCHPYFTHHACIMILFFFFLRDQHTKQKKKKKKKKLSESHHIFFYILLCFFQKMY